MDDDQQFCLRWNNHQSTLIAVFDTLLEKGIHVDCTLAAEGQTLKAHKVVLSACSPYFENVLSQQYDKHPIIILKDVKYAELRAMMDYMYRGEVNISQDQLAALLKAAESLQIKGLSDNKPARQPSPAGKMSESICSREGSASPSRRRKKARRASADGVPVAVAPAPAVAPAVPAPAPVAAPAATPAPADAPPAEPAPDLKLEEGSRGGGEGDGEGVEDLTLDEENEEPLPAHNDVVRNFQWHMERSQDEMMNADGARDSQGSTAGTKTDPSNNKPIKSTIENASTFAVLRNVVLTNEDKIEPKPDHSDTEISNKLSTVSAPRIDAVGGNHSLVKEKTIAVNETTNKGLKNEKATDKIEKVIECEGEIIQKRKRGRPPKVEKRGKFSKKGKTTLIETKDKPLCTLKDKKADVKKKEESYKLETKTCVYDFDYFSNDSSAPLPCSEYKSEKGYKCPNCQRCYNARKNLVRHITLECGREPQYQCPHCPYSKHRRNELKKHIQKKHANEPERAIKRKH